MRAPKVKVVLIGNKDEQAVFIKNNRYLGSGNCLHPTGKFYMHSNIGAGGHRSEILAVPTRACSVWDKSAQNFEKCKLSKI